MWTRCILLRLADSRKARSGPRLRRRSIPAKLFELTQQVRQVFDWLPQPPRWPMYIRQFKQFLRANDRLLEQQTAGQGALLDLLRACQREGTLRLERDRRGQMRVFPGHALQQPSPATDAVSASELPLAGTPGDSRRGHGADGRGRARRRGRGAH